MRALPFRWKSFLVLMIFSAAVFFTGALAEKMSGLLEGVESYIPGVWQKIKSFIQERFIFKVGSAGCGAEFERATLNQPAKGSSFIRGP